jgi:hypothetical protein
MTFKRMRWLAAAGAALLLPCLAAAEEVVWRAARTPPPAPTAPRAPVATLGRPVPLPPAEPAPAAYTLAAAPAGRPARIASCGGGAVVRCQMADPPAEPTQEGVTTAMGVEGQPDTASLVPTTALSPLVPTTGPAVGTAPAQPVGVEEPSLHTAAGPTDPPPPPAPDVLPVATDHSVAPTFWEKCRGWLNWNQPGSTNGRHSFQSDTCFNGIVSPLSNPFFFEDPRSLTEVRPIFMYQGVPSKSPYPGGDAYFFGTQARVAFTEQFSVVLNELGVVSLDPNNTANYSNHTGFAEVKIGPKFTFVRSDSTGTVAAAGLTFELPVGSARVYQDTGTLGLDPYVTVAQTFGKLPNGYGSFDFIGELGYSFATDSERSEFLHMSLHLDYNFANRVYPLVELNWLHYTSAGKNDSLGYEGADLINFGSSTRDGQNFVDVAVGARYRFTDNIFGGTAVEFPLSAERGYEKYRLTFDVIFRY